MGQKYPMKPIELSYLVRVSFQLRNGGHLVKSMLLEDRNCGQQNITSCGMSVSCSTVDVYMAKPCVFKSTGTGLVGPDRQRTRQILCESGCQCCYYFCWQLFHGATRQEIDDLSSGQTAGSKDRMLDWEGHRFARGRRLRANNVVFSGGYSVRANGKWLLSCQQGKWISQS